MRCSLRLWISTCVTGLIFAGVSSADAIRVQPLEMISPGAGRAHREVLLKGAVDGIEVEHVALAGPATRTVTSPSNYDVAYLFLKGRARVRAGDWLGHIEQASIALPAPGTSLQIDLAEGDSLHYVRVRKLLSPGDRADLGRFASGSRKAIYFANFSDGQADTADIESTKAIHRTILPNDHMPRVSMGTVETRGPDRVGAHEHLMLDRLFLGLEDNDVIVHADEEQVRFPEFSLLHIPLGSSHWVEAGEDRRTYYLWMEFFLTREGQEWLKTREPVERNGQ